MTQELSSDTSVADNFDGPVIEVVHYFKPGEREQLIASGNARPRPPARDVKLSRPDMDYWATWCGQIRQARQQRELVLLQRQPQMEPLARIRAQAEIMRRDVQIFEATDQQFYPAGIRKILDDALAAAGMTDPNERAAVLRAIPPLRQQVLAGEVCSEPRATIEQLRDAARQLAQKLGTSPALMAAWGDEQLIDFMRNYTPPPPVVPMPGAGGEQLDEGGDPLAPTVPGDARPGEGSTGAPAMPSSSESSEPIPGA